MDGMSATNKRHFYCFKSRMMTQQQDNRLLGLLCRWGNPDETIDYKHTQFAFHLWDSFVDGTPPSAKINFPCISSYCSRTTWNEKKMRCEEAPILVLIWSSANVLLLSTLGCSATGLFLLTARPKHACIVSTKMTSCMLCKFLIPRGQVMTAIQIPSCLPWVLC